MTNAADDALPPGLISPGLAVTSVITSRGACLAVRGELDMSTAHLLLDAVRELCRPGRLTAGTVVELDARELTFVDAVGLTTLLRARRLVDDHGVHLQLTGVQPFTARLLRLTRVGERLGLDDEPSSRRGL